MNIPPQELAAISCFIHSHCGIKLTEQKEYLIDQRLTPLMVSEGCSNFLEYTHFLKANPQAVLRMTEAITTHETSFFRDIHPFNNFSQNLLPELVKAHQQQMHGLSHFSPIKIWCAASSTGQEPYSLAMLINEFLEQHRSSFPNYSARSFDILATDISSDVIKYAQTGKFNTLEIQRGLSPQRLNKWFKKVSDNQWQIDLLLRQMVNFKEVNLARQFTSLGSFQLIFCRNVLIYFDDAVKKQIINQFQQMIRPGGYLILGSMENMYGLSDHFDTVYFGQSVVYKKR